MIAHFSLFSVLILAPIMEVYVEIRYYTVENKQLTESNFGNTYFNNGGQ